MKHVCQPGKTSPRTGLLPDFWLLSISLLTIILSIRSSPSYESPIITTAFGRTMLAVLNMSSQLGERQEA